MGPPEAEWMLWAKRFQIEHNHLLKIVKSTAELTIRIHSAEEEVKDLASSSKSLQEQNNSLQQQVRQMEDDAASRELANEEHTEQLRAKVASLETTLSSLIKTEDKWMGEIGARCNKTEEEVHDLKARLNEPRAFVPLDLPKRAVSRQPSLATTADESVQVRGDGISMPEATSYPEINIKAQGNEALEEYIHYGKAFLAEELQQYDIRAAKTFVSGMKSKYYRVTLWEKLEVLGWSTRNATEEAQRILEDGKRRKKRRQRLLQQLR